MYAKPARFVRRRRDNAARVQTAHRNDERFAFELRIEQGFDRRVECVEVEMKDLSQIAKTSKCQTRQIILPWRLGDSNYAAVMPPSTGSAAPVMKLASSLARNKIVRATSSGVAMRPSGCFSAHTRCAFSTSPYKRQAS